MIQLVGVSKTFETKDGYKNVLSNINCKILKGERIGIIGINGAGKTTLVRIIAGILGPDSGKIIKQMRVSWPVGYTGGFNSNITALDNIKFISRIYNKDYRHVVEFVKEFSELKDDLSEPLSNYSSGMRARLNFALLMAIDFDCFLIDELLSVGDAKFRMKCDKEIITNRANRGMIMVSHNDQLISRYCSKAYVLYNRTLCPFENVPEALKFYYGTN
jgi:capsular polysaccharide transport system ATP-binding protein